MTNKFSIKLKSSLISCFFILFFTLSNVYAENIQDSCSETKIQTNIVLKDLSLNTDNIYDMKNLNNVLILEKYIGVCDKYKVDHEKNTITLMMEDTTKLPNLECFLRLINLGQRISLTYSNLSNKKIEDLMDIKSCKEISKKDAFLANQIEKMKFLETIYLKKE